MKHALLVMLGGGCGAVLRELLMLGVDGLPGGFPMPIFIANLVACFFIGVISAPTIEGGAIGRGSKLFLATGVRGGLSTFVCLGHGPDARNTGGTVCGRSLSCTKYGPRVYACQTGIETG